ncbi:DUF4232 domain-containing protein [Amycolatopsis minnesotensis]
MMKRTAAATIAGGVLAGGMLLATGSASAMPSDTPCGASDVNVSVTPDPTHASGHEAYLITYTAASEDTNCKLQGTPTDVSFAGDGQAVGISVVPEPASGGAGPVNLRAGHPAESRLVQAAHEAPLPQIPVSVTFDLPTGPDGQPVSVAWPEGQPLKGTEVQTTAVSAVDGG